MSFGTALPLNSPKSIFFGHQSVDENFLHGPRLIKNDKYRNSPKLIETDGIEFDFTYGGGAIQRPSDGASRDAVKQKLTPLYPIAKKTNQRIAAWGPQMMGRTSAGLFGTSFGATHDAWPFAHDTTETKSVFSLATSAMRRLVS